MTNPITSSAADHDPIWPVDRNVVLTGFMGTGKSTVGRALAARLGYEFVDTDDLIEMRYGSVASIFESRGETGFRDLEHDVARALATSRRTVIATGGRMMLDDRNVAALAPTSRLCCLVAKSDEIVKRLAADTGRHERPLLQSTGGGPELRSRVEQLLAERDGGYRRFLRIATGQRHPEAIADEIAGVMSAAPRRIDSDPPIIVGAALLSTLAEVVGPIGGVIGDDAAKFAPQIERTGGDRVVAVGPTPGAGSDVATVWVPTVLPISRADSSAASSLPPTPEVIVFDAAVLQAATPGYTSWTDALAAIAAVE